MELDSIFVFFPSIEADNIILFLLVTFRIVGTPECDGVYKKISNIPLFPFAPRVNINIQALSFLILKVFLLLGSIRPILPFCRIKRRIHAKGHPSGVFYYEFFQKKKRREAVCALKKKYPYLPRMPS